MDIFEILMMVLIIGGPAAYVALQVYGVVRLAGWWRGAALVPLIVMVPVAAITANALSQGSNLWPILLILASPFAVLYLLIVIVLAWALQRRRVPSSSESSATVTTEVLPK